MTTHNQKNHHKRENQIIVFWLIIVIFLIASLADAFILHHFVQKERIIQKDQVELVELGWKLASSSDKLTSEARAFAVTSAPIHLNNFWEEVEVTQTRERALERLKQLRAIPQAVDLLAKAKKHSDRLIHTKEVHSMKLVLVANGVPESVMPRSIQELDLPAEEQELKPTDKILKAQSLLFNASYEEAKAQIRAPITQLRAKQQESITEETKRAQKTTTFCFYALIALLIAMLVAIITLVWFRLTLLIDRY